MAWFSILPPQFAFIEDWLVRLFLLLAALTIGPWLLLIVYDFVLYIIRTVWYETPYIGGRASGAQRPRAPSLGERPDGRLRRISIVGLDAIAEEDPQKEGTKGRGGSTGVDNRALRAADMERREENRYYGIRDESGLESL